MPHTQTDRQTDRQTDIHAQTHTNTDTHKQTHSDLVVSRHRNLLGQYLVEYKIFFVSLEYYSKLYNSLT